MVRNKEREEAISGKCGDFLLQSSVGKFRCCPLQSRELTTPKGLLP